MLAASNPLTPDGGDPNILELPEHSKGLGQPVVTDGYGKPSKYEGNVQRRRQARRGSTPPMPVALPQPHPQRRTQRE